MTVPTEKIDLEHASDFVEAKVLLSAVLSGSLPCFVLDAAGTSRADIEASFAPVLLANNFMFRHQDEQVTVSELGGLGENREPERPFTELNSGTKDFSAHIDFPPYSRGPAVSVVNLHLTTQGIARGSFYAFNPVFAARSPGELPRGTSANITAGLVDPEIVEPKYYSANLSAGHLAVFCTGGRSPLIHHFETVEPPRNSFVMRALNKDGMY